MLNANQVIKASIDGLTKNAPAILTAFGVVGVATTAVLTAKATFAAAEKLREAQIDRNVDEGVHSPLTKAEKVKIVWPLYIAATTTGVLSCGAIIMSNRISSKRAAVLAAAYAINQDRLEEYRDKVEEKFGIKKEKDVRDSIAQDKTTKDFEGNNEILFSPVEGKVCIREEYTGRYFWSTKEIVDNAVNQINAMVIREGSARLSDLYDLVGLDHVSTSDHFGWTTEHMLGIDWGFSETPDKKTPVFSFEYVPDPMMNPEREATFR